MALGDRVGHRVALLRAGVGRGLASESVVGGGQRYEPVGLGGICAAGGRFPHHSNVAREQAGGRCVRTDAEGALGADDEGMIVDYPMKGHKK